MQKRSWPDTAAPDNSAELVFPLFFGFLVCKITSFCSFSQSNFQAQWATFFFPRHKAVKSSQFTEVQQPKRENVVIKKNWKFSWDQTQSSKQSVGHKETAVYAEKRFCCSDFSHFKWKYLRQTHVLPSHYTFWCLAKNRGRSDIYYVAASRGRKLQCGSTYSCSHTSLRYIYVLKRCCRNLNPSEMLKLFTSGQLNNSSCYYYFLNLFNLFTSFLFTVCWSPPWVTSSWQILDYPKSGWWTWPLTCTRATSRRTPGSFPISRYVLSNGAPSFLANRILFR